MKPIKLLLGLVSSLLLAVGLTKAAEIVDPLAGRLATKVNVLNNPAAFCGIPTNWADPSRLVTQTGVLNDSAAFCGVPTAWAITNR